jgi:hypothetical protein
MINVLVRGGKLSLREKKPYSPTQVYQNRKSLVKVPSKQANWATNQALEKRFKMFPEPELNKRGKAKVVGDRRKNIISIFCP